MMHRRSLLVGLGVALFAPAIVRVESLMPIRMPVVTVASPLELALSRLAAAQKQFNIQIGLAIAGNRAALEQITYDAQGLMGAAVDVYGR